MEQQRVSDSVGEEEPHPGARPLRWGVLGAARIARKALVRAIREAGGEVAAIGAGSLDRARAFADELEIPEAYEGYAPVVHHPRLDAIYLPLANGLHFRWALACARAQKHCLCEKPLVLTAVEARELRAAFGENGRRLMEAFMWRHSPAWDWILEQVRGLEVGTVRRVHGAFAFPLGRPEDYRWRDDQGGGALWDIGTYCVNAARFIFGCEPRIVSARSEPVRRGAVADRSTVGWLDFGDDRLAGFECSFDSAYDQYLVITGSEGSMRVERPFTTSSGTTTLHVRIGRKSNSFEFRPVDPYVYMVEHFARAVHDRSFALAPGEDGVEQATAMQALTESALAGGDPRLLDGYRG